jgi:hypothetical protein
MSILIGVQLRPRAVRKGTVFSIHYQRKPVSPFSAATGQLAPLASIQGRVPKSVLGRAKPLILPALLLRSNDGRPIAWCIFGFFAGLYLFYRGFRLLQRRQLILNTPVSKIRSASMGMVELNGLAVGPYTMIAPITERACYYYRTVAWEWKRRGRSSQWVKVAAECMHVPFFLDDNTGKVMVDPCGADLDLHRDFHQEFCDGLFTIKEEAPANVHSFLSRHGVSTTNKIKVEEFCIKPKNSLFMLGTLDDNPGLEVTQQPIQDEEHNTLTLRSALNLSFNSEGERGSLSNALSLSGGLQHDPKYDAIYEQAASTVSAKVIRLSPDHGSTDQGSADHGSAKAADMTQQQKIAAAMLKAGIASPAAWAAAKVIPAQTPVGVQPDRASLESLPNAGGHAGTQTGSELDGFDPHPPVVLMKGKNNPTFLISWRSQRDLARSLGWKCTLMIWGGPALSLLCLYGLQSLTHWF